MSPAPSNLDLAIRPLGLGEVIDRAVALTRHHFRTLFPWMLLVQAPAIAASRLQLAGLGELLGDLSDPSAALASVKALGRSSGWVLFALFLLQAAATALCAWIVAPSLLAGAGSNPPTTPRRVIAVATAGLATLLLFVAVPAAFALPGLLLLGRADSPAGFTLALLLFLAGGVVGLVITVLRTLLVPVVGAIEGRLFFGAVARASALMRSTPGLPLVERPALRASLVLLATFAVAVAVNLIVGIPRGLLGRAAGGSGFLAATLPLWAELPLGAFETVASAALQPFSLVAVAVLYFDRRARREGLDLARFAAEAEGAGTP